MNTNSNLEFRKIKSLNFLYEVNENGRGRHWMPPLVQFSGAIPVGATIGRPYNDGFPCS